MLEFTDAWMGTQERVEGFVLLEKTRAKRFKKKGPILNITTPKNCLEELYSLWP